MKHHHYENWLPLAAGQDLSPLRQLLLSRHLKRCAACRQELAAYEQLSKAVPLGFQTVDDEASLIESVLLSLPPQDTPCSTDSPSKGWGKLAFPLLAAVAVLMALMIHRAPSENKTPDLSAQMPVVEEAPENTTVLTFETDDPDITIVWFLQEDETSD